MLGIRRGDVLTEHRRRAVFAAKARLQLDERAPVQCLARSRSFGITRCVIRKNGVGLGRSTCCSVRLRLLERWLPLPLWRWLHEAWSRHGHTSRTAQQTHCDHNSPDAVAQVDNLANSGIGTFAGDDMEWRRTTVGTSMMNVVPTPILLSHRILPSWASTMPFTMAS